MTVYTQIRLISGSSGLFKNLEKLGYKLLNKKGSGLASEHTFYLGNPKDKFIRTTHYLIILYRINGGKEVPEFKGSSIDLKLLENFTIKP